MKTLLALPVLLTLSALSTGCGDTRADHRALESEPAPAAIYKAGHGLQFSPAAMQIVGLKTGEVRAPDVAAANGVTAIPAEALLRTVKGDFVFVVNGEWFLRTVVVLGASGGAFHEVKEGLYEGDQIVTQGVRALWLAELQAVNGGVACADHH